MVELVESLLHQLLVCLSEVLDAATAKTASLAFSLHPKTVQQDLGHRADEDYSSSRDDLVNLV